MKERKNEIKEKRKNERTQDLGRCSSLQVRLVTSRLGEGCMWKVVRMTDVRFCTYFACPSMLSSGLQSYYKPIGSLLNSCNHSSLFTSCWIHQAALIRRLPACDWSLSVSLGLLLLIQMTERVFNFQHWPPDNKVRSRRSIMGEPR